jgi:hypothetical protein
MKYVLLINVIKIIQLIFYECWSKLLMLLLQESTLELNVFPNIL